MPHPRTGSGLSSRRLFDPEASGFRASLQDEPLPYPEVSTQTLWTLPGSGLALFYGHPQTARLMHYFLVRPLGRGETILLLDAANCFDAYRVARFALRRGRPPQEYLRRIRISRAFTCYQLAALLERVPGAVRRTGAGLILVTGLPDIFCDEEIPAAKVRAVFADATKSLLAVSRLRLPLVVFSNQPDAAGGPGRFLLEQLKQHADYIWKLAEEEQGLRCRCEKAARPVSAGQVSGGEQWGARYPRFANSST